ncbi:hypothetical protein ACFWWM_38975 [Streptomyces sp. NPDC058682]|uniref:hypothetical protein n=1 Tax=Streptomyces sp. NPDC058682 TaxID=3346596 RepID=UPI00365B64D3
MSDAIAYPVFRTPDPALALSTARSLVEFGRCAYSRVSAYTEFHSVAEVRALAKELPTGWFRGQEEYGEFDGVPLEDRPPLEWELLNVPVGSIEDAFTAAIGPSRGEINWALLCWPDAPGAGFHGESKHAEVTLLFNTTTRDLDEPADEHTVLLHVRSALVDGRQLREPYAHWLADQLGLTVVGPGQR